MRAESRAESHAASRRRVVADSPLQPARLSNQLRNQRHHRLGSYRRHRVSVAPSLTSAPPPSRPPRGHPFHPGSPPNLPNFPTLRHPDPGPSVLETSGTPSNVAYYPTCFETAHDRQHGAREAA